MTNMLKSKKLLKKLIIFIIAIYVVYIFISQHRVLSSYRALERHYVGQVEVQAEKRENLIVTRENIDSIEYIETMAREQLDMFLPNERVFVNFTR